MSKHQAFIEQLCRAEQHLVRRDPILRPLIKHHGPCQLRPHTRYFETLVEAIISQQLSSKAATTILNRFKALYESNRFPTTAQILTTDSERLRSVGISGQKISYLKDLAVRAEDGTLRLARLTRLSDQEVIDMLVKVKGIGVWTAQMFLIFSLGRLNILPVGDLGVRRAIERLYGFAQIPKTDEIERIAMERQWHPYCSVASWYLWRSVDASVES